MLTYSFADIGSESIYIYLYKCIKNDILSGVLRAGEKLPSKRSFAKNLGISTITVENAYAQLQAEGYIYSIAKKGFFVNDISENQIISKHIGEITVPASTASKSYIADFVSNRTSPENFPFSVWAGLMRKVISEQSDELMTTSPGGGVYELRKAICDHLFQFRNMKVEPEQIIIGAGTEYLYGLIIQLLGHGKTYAVENPGYKKISQIYESNNVRCVYASLDESGVSIDSLEKSGADIIHISPAHHYPTGIVTPIGRRYELLGWASKSDSRYIIEDDYDSEFRLNSKPVPMLQSIDVLEKVIYINTFSKSLSSTVRISYMVLPPHLLEQYRKKLGFYSCTVSNFEQYTLARFISEGYFEKHINRMRTYYKNLRDELLVSLKGSTLSDRVQITEENSGLHFLMHVDTELSDAEIVKSAERNGIRIKCLSQYYSESDGADRHITVMNYSGLSAKDISGAVAALEKSF